MPKNLDRIIKKSEAQLEEARKRLEKTAEKNVATKALFLLVKREAPKVEVLARKLKRKIEKLAKRKPPKAKY